MSLSYYHLENINKYEEWYDKYHLHLDDMHKIFIKNLKSNNIKYKNTFDNFRQFCEFVYNNSSKQ